MQSTPYSCQILIKLELSQHILENSSDIKFHGNSSIGSRAVPCGQAGGQMDGHDKLLLAFRNFANAPNRDSIIIIIIIIIIIFLLFNIWVFLFANFCSF
jgi:hypothetical protein